MDRSQLADLIMELARRATDAEQAATLNKSAYEMAQADLRHLESELEKAKGEIQRLEAELSQAEAWSAAREADLQSGRRREANA